VYADQPSADHRESTFGLFFQEHSGRPDPHLRCAVLRHRHESAGRLSLRSPPGRRPDLGLSRDDRAQTRWGRHSFDRHGAQGAPGRRRGRL